jgi:pimeloyl-ACP methyl ester carboxylesterase
MYLLGRIHYIHVAHIKDFFILPKTSKKVVYYFFGRKSRPTILLVHGWNSFAASYYHFVKLLLIQKYNVLTLDLPAHGNSGGDETDIEEVVTALLYLQEKYGTFQSVIAHSFGGVAASYALSKGLKTNSLILLNVPSDFKTLVDVYSKEYNVNGQARHFLNINIENHFPILKEKIWRHFSTVPNLVAKDSTLPILIIHDRNDDMIGPEHGVILHRNLPNSMFIKSSGQGHNGILRDKAVLKNCIFFIDELKK